jgi:hypothetical protein
MNQYDIVSVLWEDHTTFHNTDLPTELDDLIRPSLTIGVLYKETERHLVIASHIERYEYSDSADYTVILKGSVLGMKKYGEITIENLRSKEGS